jgi:hypothetical protein
MSGEPGTLKRSLKLDLTYTANGVPAAGARIYVFFSYS